MHLRVVALAVALTWVAGERAAACTAFTAGCGKTTLVGNNEDYDNPRVQLRFVPGASGELGRMYIGYAGGAQGIPQGGMNEAGLFFDGFAVERQPVGQSAGKPRFDGVFVDKVMAECRTVEEVERLVERYDRSFLESAVLMFVDRGGAAIAVEGDAIVRNARGSFVQTNFRQSKVPPAEISCPRFKTAKRLLEQAGKCATLEEVRDALAATSVRGQYPTLYSNVYDLQRGVMHLYYFRDFDHPKTIDLRAELKRGPHVLELAELFPENEAARAFAREREAELARRTVVVDEAVLSAHAGRYRLPDGTVLIVRKTPAGLTAETPGSLVELSAESATAFVVPHTPVKLTFVVGASGRTEGIDLLSGTGAHLLGERIPED